MNEKDALMILNAIPGLTNRRIVSLMEGFASAADILSASFERLKELQILSEESIRHIIAFDRNDFLEKEKRLMQEHGVHVVCYQDDDYPDGLRHIPDAPVVLYVKGQMPDDWRKAIAVVGSRNASMYGRMMARRLAAQLAEKGCMIISGLARGIDKQAHEGCLSVNGCTVAVLGCGLACVYPPEHEKLYERIIQAGALVSEFPMNALPLSFNFPRRNRIISGLSQGVLVVEAAQRSGAIITADFALEQGKEVYALPGPVDQAGSYGVHELIKQGAKLITGVEDILEDFDQTFNNRIKRFEQASLSSDESVVYQALHEKTIHLDELVHTTGFKASQVLSTLLALELKQLVKQLPGKYFIRE
ncbi:MAG TPA: DNA-processing protein DprA [Candidatus Omnitrophota bacterium]|nr:DNA-processing protein DprA [Candidatus Omnitrophota bacterium]